MKPLRLLLLVPMLCCASKEVRKEVNKEIKKNHREAMTHRRYQELANRFNRELAGRFPFGDSNSRDASLSTVRSFFIDYDAQAQAPETESAAVKRVDAWKELQFLQQLDRVSAFLRTSLAAKRMSRPLTLTPHFHPSSNDSIGGGQIVSWIFFCGSLTLRSTDTNKSMD